jgi:hypothetical protein
MVPLYSTYRFGAVRLISQGHHRASGYRWYSLVIPVHAYREELYVSLFLSPYWEGFILVRRITVVFQDADEEIQRG